MSASRLREEIDHQELEAVDVRRLHSAMVGELNE
jgi:hypothetical protein